MDFYKEWLGIPEGTRPPNHYELLRVKQFEDDTDKIRAHYKKLNAHVRKYATGQYSVESQDMLNEMAKAMLCLTDADRKRDYDEGLGREFPEERDDFGRQPLLDVLVRQGHISRDQRREVEEFADRRGLTHRDAVVQMKLAPPNKAAQALAAQLGYSYVDLEDMLPEDDVLDMVPRSLVKHHSFIPLFIDDGQLLVACIDQPEHELEDELRLRYDVPVRPVIAIPRAINQAITQYYAPGMRDEAKSPAASAAPAKGKAKAKGKTATAEGKSKTTASKADQRSFTELSPEEQKERKQYGMVFICWSLIIPMLPLLIRAIAPSIGRSLPLALFYLPYAAILTLPATTFWVTQKYWK